MSQNTGRISNYCDYFASYSHYQLRMVLRKHIDLLYAMYNGMSQYKGRLSNYCNYFASYSHYQLRMVLRKHSELLLCPMYEPMSK